MATPVELVWVLTPDEGGTFIPVYVQPRASRTALVGVHDGMLKIAVAAPPVDGEANKALLKGLASILGVSKGQVTLLGGATGRRKRLRVEGLTPQEVAERLAG